MTNTNKKYSRTLTNKQLELIMLKMKSHRLFFAILFKFYERYHRFFDTPREMDYNTIRLIANQLNIHYKSLKLNLTKRTVTRFHDEIRGHFQSSGVTKTNEDSIKQWLILQVFPKQDLNPTQLFGCTAAFIKKEKMERNNKEWIILFHYFTIIHLVNQF